MAVSRDKTDQIKQVKQCNNGSSLLLLFVSWLVGANASCCIVTESDSVLIDQLSNEANFLTTAESKRINESLKMESIRARWSTKVI